MSFLGERIIFQESNVELKDLNYIKTLGEGSFGVVYLVKEKAAATYYALKRVRIIIKDLYFLYNLCFDL